MKNKITWTVSSFWLFLIATFCFSVFGGFHLGPTNSVQANTTTTVTAGPWQRATGYATLTQADQPIYQTLGQTVRGSSSTLLNQTFRISGQYKMSDGTVYYSLNRHNGSWLGYMNSRAVKRTSDVQGAYIGHQAYVGIANTHYTIWRNFHGKAITTTKHYAGQILMTRGQYHHFNGSTYISLQAQNGKWLGYVNQGGVRLASSPAGPATTANYYVTITGAHSPVWRTLSWQKLTAAGVDYHKTYQVRQVYHHLNGSTYLALFDDQGRSHGFINANGTKVAKGPQGIGFGMKQRVKITNDHQSIWGGFSFTSATPTRNYLGQTFMAKVAYIHSNGGTYYSLYRANGQWLGYINKGFTTAQPNVDQQLRSYLSSVTRSGQVAVTIQSLTPLANSQAARTPDPVLDVANGIKLNYHGATTKYSASTYKLYIAAYLFYRYSRHGISWTSSVQKDFDSMIVHSTNDFAESMLARYGRNNVNAYLHTLGIGSVFGKNVVSHTTSNDLARILTLLANGQGPFANASKRNMLLNDMKKQVYRNGIPKGIAKVDARATVQDKVGFLWTTNNDAAIVTTSTGHRFLLVIMTTGHKTLDFSQIASIAQGVMQRYR